MSTTSSSASSPPSSTSTPSSTGHGQAPPPLNPSIPDVPKPLPSPIRLSGSVVYGFQRGSKLLGFPTANLDPAAFKGALPSLPYGVYMGWAQVDEGEVHPTVLSFGTNPTFNTSQDTLEAYIMHRFSEDFYGHRLSLVILAHVRPQYSLTSMEELIAWIQNDVDTALRTLQEPPYSHYRNDPHFSSHKPALRSHV